MADDFIIVVGDERAIRHLREAKVVAEVESRKAAAETRVLLYEALIEFGGTEKLRGRAGARFHGANRVVVETLHRHRLHGADVVDTFSEKVTLRELAMWIERGTGLFGPLHRRIEAKHSLPKGTKGGSYGRLNFGGDVFRKSVKGTPAKPFVKESLEAIRPEVTEIWRRVGHAIVRAA